MSLKGERFLLFDSGIGDVERLLIFGTTQMLSLLQDLNRKNYIGRRLPIEVEHHHTQSESGNMYAPKARTNNAVEGWHNAFKSGVNCTNPNFIKLLSHLQKEQSLQEANVVRILGF